MLNLARRLIADPEQLLIGGSDPLDTWDRQRVAALPTLPAAAAPPITAKAKASARRKIFIAPEVPDVRVLSKNASQEHAGARLKADAVKKLDPQNDEPGAAEHDVKRFERLFFPRRKLRELRHDGFQVVLYRCEIRARLINLSERE